MDNLIGKKFKIISKYGLSVFTSTITEISYSLSPMMKDKKSVAKINMLVKGEHNWYNLKEVVLLLGEKHVSPNHGGCWFCHTQGEDMYLDWEFDTFVHLECIIDALKSNKNDSEALLMTYLLDEGMLEFPKYRPELKSHLYSDHLILKDVENNYHIGQYHWHIKGNYFITQGNGNFGEHYIKSWKYLRQENLESSGA